MARVKICGLTDAAAVDAALAAGADWIGFVFHPKSPRAVTPERAAALAAPARGRAKVVAVVADGDDALLSAIGRSLSPDAVQLHGREGPGRLDQARALAGGEAWKALPVAARADLDAERALRI